MSTDDERTKVPTIEAFHELAGRLRELEREWDATADTEDEEREERR